MANEKFDYGRFISDIDAKIAALQALRSSVQAAAAVGALGEAIDGAEAPGAPRNSSQLVPADLPEGAFMGKSVGACIELYLSAAKKKKTNKEIAEALREGGVESTSDDFDTIIAGALFKLKKAGKVLRFKDGWGLADWYPAHIRGAVHVPAKKASKKKRRQKKSGSTSVVVERTTTPVGATQPSPAAAAAQILNSQDRILMLLRGNPGREFSAQQILAALPEVKANVVRLLLGRITNRKLAELTPSGNYRAPLSNVSQMAAVG